MSEFALSAVKLAICQICNKIGFQSLNERSLDILSSIYVDYLKDLSKSSTALANHSNRAQVILDDLLLIFKHKNLNIDELNHHMRTVEPPQFCKGNRSVPLFPCNPIKGYARLNLPDEEETRSRSEFIDPWLPPLKVNSLESEDIVDNGVETIFDSTNELKTESPITNESERPDDHIFLSSVYIDAHGHVVGIAGREGIAPSRGLPPICSDDEFTFEEDETQPENLVPTKPVAINGDKVMRKTKGKLKWLKKKGEKLALKDGKDSKLSKDVGKSKLKLGKRVKMKDKLGSLSIKVSGIKCGDLTAVSPPSLAVPTSEDIKHDELGCHPNVDDSIESVISKSIEFESTPVEKKRKIREPKLPGAKKVKIEKPVKGKRGRKPKHPAIIQTIDEVIEKAMNQEDDEEEEAERKEDTIDDRIPAEDRNDNDVQSSNDRRLYPFIDEHSNDDVIPVPKKMKRGDDDKEAAKILMSLSEDSFVSPVHSPVDNLKPPPRPRTPNFPEEAIFNNSLPPITMDISSRHSHPPSPFQPELINSRVLPPLASTPAPKLPSTTATEMPSKPCVTPKLSVKTVAAKKVLPETNGAMVNTSISIDKPKKLKEKKLKKLNLKTRQEFDTSNLFQPDKIFEIKPLMKKEPIQALMPPQPPPPAPPQATTLQSQVSTVQVPRSIGDKKMIKIKKHKDKVEKRLKIKEIEPIKVKEKKDKIREKDHEKMRDRDHHSKVKIEKDREHREKAPEVIKISKSQLVINKDEKLKEKKKDRPKSNRDRSEEKPKKERRKEKEIKESKSCILITETINENDTKLMSDEKVWICPVCKIAYEATDRPMVGCDGCDDWYHWHCVGIVSQPPEDESWFCICCVSKREREAAAAADETKFQAEAEEAARQKKKAKELKEKHRDQKEIKKKEKEKLKAKFELIPNPPPILKNSTAEWHCAVCKSSDDKDTICCDRCDQWFHWSCVGIVIPPRSEDSWFCNPCIKRRKAK